MNNKRRKVISSSLVKLQVSLPILNKALESKKDIYYSISNDEDKEERRNALEEQIDLMENAISNLEEAIGILEMADF